MMIRSRLHLIIARLNLILLMLSFVIILNLPVLRVYGQATDIRVVNPQTDDTQFQFYTNETSLGSRFNITIYVYDVTDLYTYQVKLYYNSTILNVSRGWIPPDNPDYIFYGENSFESPIIMHDPSIGDAVLVGGTLMGAIEGVSGTGLLAILEFEIIYAEEDTMKALGAVSCNLDLDNDDTFLWNSTAPWEEWISTSKTNGFYQYTWVELLEPYLEAIPRRHQSEKLEIFNITLWLHNIQSVHRLVNISFILSYDFTFLNVTQVSEGSFLAESGETDFNYTSALGNLTILNSLTPPYTEFPEGEGEIAIVTFKGIYQDAEEHSSNIMIQDIQLLDDSQTNILLQPELTRHSTYTIKPQTSQITINLPQERFVGENVIINGTISPEKNGAEVTIYHRIQGTTVWGTLTTTTSDNESYYAYTWKPDETNYLEFYASWPGDNFTLGAESTILTIEIKPSIITISLTPGETVNYGNNVTITGEIKPTNANVNVTIQYKPSGETNWILLGTVKTDSEGHYTYLWVNPDIGEYTVRSSWAEGTSSEKTIRVVTPIDILTYLPYIAIAIVIIIIVIVLYFKKIR